MKHCLILYHLHLIAADRRVAREFFLTEEARLAHLPRFSLAIGAGFGDVISSLTAGIVAPLYTGGALEAQLDDKKVVLHVDKAARELLAEKGNDPKMGARPMSRYIQEHVKKPLANALLFGELARGGKVSVSVSNGELDIEIESEIEKA